MGKVPGDAEPSKIYGLWIGDCLSKVEQLVLASYMANGHVFHLYTYGAVKNVPDGVVLLDANAVIKEEHIFKNRKGSLAIFSDWFRWEMLFKHGAYWVDMDMVCLRPLPAGSDFVFGWEGELIGSALLKFPAGHPFCRYMADNCANPNKILPYDSLRYMAKKWLRRYLGGNRRGNTGWGEVGGPKGLTKALKYFGLESFAHPESAFFPIDYGSWESIYRGEGGLDAPVLRSAYTVHLFNEMLRQRGYAKDKDYPSDSLFEQLKRRYLK